MDNPLLLIMRLEGPLQSWGTRGRWDYRDSGEDPTKSGIIGLLGCALGYQIMDKRLEELDSLLTMGVRVENPGLKLVDFHTVMGDLPTAEGKRRDTTIVSSRVYLQDAAFLVVISGPEQLLRQCNDALLRPSWPFYLGRKSCIPTRPILDGLSKDYSSIEQALSRYPWSWTGHNTLSDNPPTQLRCIMDCAEGNAMRNDRLQVNPARMYGFRRVRSFFVEFPGKGEDGVQCTSLA